MTCVIGLQHKGKVYMGADSAFVFDSYLMSGNKILRAGDFLLSSSGRARPVQLLAPELAKMTPPKTKPREFLTAKVVPMYQKIVAENFCSQVEKQNDHRSLSEIVIAWRSHLYMISVDFCVVEPNNRFIASGSGQGVATGALYATPKIAPRTRLRIALEAAEAYTTTVRSPFVILSTEDD